MNPERWRLGDRVGVQLPTGYRTGVVVGIDPPGLPRGVKVRFPPSVGIPDCYATYAELVRLPDGSEESRKLLRACLADPELRAQLEAMAGRTRSTTAKTRRLGGLAGRQPHDPRSARLRVAESPEPPRRGESEGSGMSGWEKDDDYRRYATAGGPGHYRTNEAVCQCLEQGLSSLACAKGPLVCGLDAERALDNWTKAHTPARPRLALLHEGSDCE